jgi:hypothetical protein
MVERSTPSSNSSSSAAAAAAAAASEQSYGQPEQQSLQDNQEPDTVDENKMHSINYNVMYTIAQDLLNDEPKVEEATCVADEEGKVPFYAEIYLKDYVKLMETLLVRCKKQEPKWLSSTLTRVLDNIERTLSSRDLKIIRPWWEETLFLSDSRKGFHSGSDAVLLAALANECLITASRLDKGTLFLTRSVEEVYGLWILKGNKHVRKFIENMPSFKTLTNGVKVDQHEQCAENNNWSGIRAALLLSSTGHTTVNFGPPIDFLVKLRIEDMERAVCTRNVALMNEVIRNVKKINQVTRYFIEDHFGMCCLFKAICGCISMSAFFPNPYMSIDVPMDAMFDTVLGEIKKMCPDLLTDSKYAYAIVLAAVYTKRYDYAAKILNVTHEINANENMTRLMVVIEQLMEDVTEVALGDPCIDFMCTLVSQYPQLVDYLRDHHGQDPIALYVLEVYNKRTM